MDKIKTYEVNLGKIWKDTFDDCVIRIRMNEFVEEWSDTLVLPETLNNEYGINEVSFVADYVTYVGFKQMTINTPNKVQNTQQYVYEGVLVEKTGRSAEKDVPKTARRSAVESTQKSILIEIKTVDSIPSFTKWVKESDLYTVIS